MSRSSSSAAEGAAAMASKTVSNKTKQVSSSSSTCKDKHMAGEGLDLIAVESCGPRHGYMVTSTHTPFVAYN